MSDLGVEGGNVYGPHSFFISTSARERSLFVARLKRPSLSLSPYCLVQVACTVIYQNSTFRHYVPSSNPAEIDSTFHPSWFNKIYSEHSPPSDMSTPLSSFLLILSSFPSHLINCFVSCHLHLKHSYPLLSLPHHPLTLLSSYRSRRIQKCLTTILFS